MTQYITVLALLLLPMTTFADDAYRELSLKYTGGSYKDEVFEYRLMKPSKLEAGKRYPLVVFLHGAGERGTDNKKQLLYLPTLMAAGQRRETYPCFVLAPQCRPSKQWVDVRWSDEKSTPMSKEPNDQLNTVIEILERTLKDEQVDPDRVYLTGLSMGGFGAWELAARHPTKFAALAPVCGGGDEAQAKRLATIPIWAFHGAADNVVKPVRSQVMVEAVRAAGGSVKYTEYEGVGHNSWNNAYADDAFFAWLFKQRRSTK